MLLAIVSVTISTIEVSNDNAQQPAIVFEKVSFRAEPNMRSEILFQLHEGTKVNIDYYIDEEVDEEDQEEVFDYFLEAESDDIEAALEEFEGAYTDEEMRLLRIKFMSDVAN